MRRLLPSLVALALIATAAVALAEVGGTPRPETTVIAATGSFEIADSHDGEPIFAAVGIAPGESTTGTVSIEDTGSEPVALTLRRDALADAPGLGGGLLSGQLTLVVADVTEPAAPRSLYGGPLDSMPDLPAGELSPGESRTFEFTATLPDGGAAGSQNALQGAATTVDYSWVASEASGDSGSDGASDSGRSYEQKGGEAGVARGGFSLRVPRIRPSLWRGRVVTWVSCDRACRLSVRGRLRASSAGGRSGGRIHLRSKRTFPVGPHRVRIRIPPGLRRWLRAAPTPVHLRARLRFVAIGVDGERDAVRKDVLLRVGRD